MKEMELAGMGQYAHGNEPSHHILYLYTMLGQPWKTADKVCEVLTTLYHDRPDGLSGNEDVGQMSAWYVLSSLGMYEAEPSTGSKSPSRAGPSRLSPRTTPLRTNISSGCGSMANPTQSLGSVMPT